MQERRIEAILSSRMFREEVAAGRAQLLGGYAYWLGRLIAIDDDADTLFKEKQVKAWRSPTNKAQ